MRKTIHYAFPALTLLAPMLAFAQFGDIDVFILEVAGFINDTIIPIILAVAFLVFIVGAVRFFLMAGEDDKSKGKSLMIYGIAAFVVIVSVWGIVKLIAGGLGLTDDTLENIPETPIGI